MSNYSDYFQLRYFHPEISQSTFTDDPDGWKRTYPHKTFVALLKRAEKMLARSSEMDKHSIWIHGAYGTGKSQVAWALRSLLTCKDTEFDAYFSDFAPLVSEGDLKKKLAGHRKARKIVVAARHGSAEISGPEDLIAAVFSSLTQALDSAKIPYDAGVTLRGGIAKWLEGSTERAYFNALIKESPYCHKGCFAGKSADDVLAILKGNGAADDLLKEIRRLAKDKGLMALRFSKEDLASWIRETVEKNNLHLILVWDEFSAFFKNNKTKLDTLQSLAELSSSTRFNLVIVTHFTTSFLPENDNSAQIIVDRFKPTMEISLPENIAFELIGDALKVKPAFKQEWDALADDLNERMEEPRRKIAKMLRDVDDGVFRAMLPFHPYAALALKNIAALFDSNQRSMFTFISAEEDARAFKWYIKNHSPENGDVLGVDLLWDYFYETGKTLRGTGETGKSNLDAQVRAILEVYPDKSGKLVAAEKRVLKTILMFQALAKKLNNPPEFLATEENLRLAFEGVEGLESGTGVTLANKLANADKILFVDEVNGKRVYQAPMATGGRDLQEIEKLKENYLHTTKTKELLKDWQREEVLRLSRPLEERFDIRLAGPDSFSQILGQLLAQDAKNYRMRAMIVVGRNSLDAVAAKEAISKALADPRSGNVVFIDATSVELDDGDFAKWAEYKARANWYARKDAQQSNNALSEAEKILSAWRDKIATGAFTVRTKRNATGVVFHGASEVGEELRLSVLEKYPLALEFERGLKDTQFNQATKAEVSAGVYGGLGHLPNGEKGGKMDAASENALIGSVKDKADYWKALPALKISKIKSKVEQKLKHAFKSGGEGRVEFGEIVEALFDVGFMPTALHGFLVGYLLKEYVGGDYRFVRDGESPPLSVANMTEAILAYFKKVLGTGGGRYHEAYIGVLTEEQRRFADLAKAVFNLGENASIDIVAHDLAVRIRDFQYPLWCFEALPEAVGSERYIEQFTLLTNPANQKGATLSGVATEIGRMAADDPGVEARLSALFTKENAARAMNAWLDEFEDGLFRKTAEEINASDPLADVRRCFGTDGAWLWHRETGENEIRSLLRDYRIVSESSKRGFITPVNSFWECMEAWRDKTRTIRIPSATLVALKPQSKTFLGLLKDIASGGRLEQNDRRDAFFHEITDMGDVNRDMIEGCLALFKATYSEQLSGLDTQEMDDLYLKGLDKSSFLADKPTYEQMLVQKVTEIKSHQGRTKLLALWNEKTATATPSAWSKQFATPILAMVPAEGTPLLEGIRNAINALNNKESSVANVDAALDFFTVHPEVFGWFDGEKADEAFRRGVLGRYSVVLTDLASVRSRLSKLSGDPDSWLVDPRLGETLQKLAESEYNLNCAERVRNEVIKMPPNEAKQYLVDLVVNSLDVGLAILSKE